jgi:YD repeat-containing protein
LGFRCSEKYLRVTGLASAQPEPVGESKTRGIFTLAKTEFSVKEQAPLKYLLFIFLLVRFTLPSVAAIGECPWHEDKSFIHGKAGTVLYRYDAGDNCTNVSGNGLTNTWTFDAYNRISSYKDANGYLIQYKYDANGNLTNLVYPGARNVYYTYDNDNHLTQVKDWSGRTTTMTYDLAGRLTTITRPNGTYRTLSYDAVGELTNIWEQMANGLPIAWLRHNWNPNATMNWEFAHDDVQR